MTFVNENKDRVEIVVRAIQDYNGKCRYRLEDIYITPYRKRKQISLAAQIRDRYDYRRLGYDERPEYLHKEYLKYCTEEQIWEAMQEAYQEMAPSKGDIEYRV